MKFYWLVTLPFSFFKSKSPGNSYFVPSEILVAYTTSFYLIGSWKTFRWCLMDARSCLVLCQQCTLTNYPEVTILIHLNNKSKVADIIKRALQINSTRTWNCHLIMRDSISSVFKMVGLWLGKGEAVLEEWLDIVKSQNCIGYYF